MPKHAGEGVVPPTAGVPAQPVQQQPTGLLLLHAGEVDLKQRPVQRA